MRSNRVWFLLSYVYIIVIFSIISGRAFKADAVQLDRPIHGFQINVEPAIVKTLAGLSGEAVIFNASRGITTDGKSFYVTNGNNTIHKFELSTGSVSTIAGSAGVAGFADSTGAAARFNSPQGITTDGKHLYVIDSNNHAIRKIAIDTSVVTTIAGTGGVAGSADGAGTAASFYWPKGITTDGTNLYVTDTWNNTVRKLVLSTGAVTTVAGKAGVTGSTDGIGAFASFFAPAGITTDGSSLYVVDSGNHTIRRIELSTGAVTTIAGTASTPGATDGAGTKSRFNKPSGITTDGVNLYVADADNNTIRKIAIDTGVVTTIAGAAGVADFRDAAGTAARFNRPSGLTAYRANLYVTDDGNHAIRNISRITQHTVIPSAGANGSINPTGAQTVNHGSTTVFTVTPDTGYTASVFNVMPAAPSEGACSHNLKGAISAECTVSPDAGYTATVGGGCGGNLVGTIYTTSAITENCMVVVKFIKKVCVYSISSDKQAFDLIGGTDNVSVTTSNNCVWKAVSNAPWITITSGGIGNSNSAVNYSVASNSGAARSGSLSIAGRTFIITQTGVQHSLVLTKSGTGLSHGQIYNNDGQLLCGDDCQINILKYDAGASVTLSAKTEPDKTFKGWSGGGCSGTGVCTITLNDDILVNAIFADAAKSSDNSAVTVIVRQGTDTSVYIPILKYVSSADFTTAYYAVEFIHVPTNDNKTWLKLTNVHTLTDVSVSSYNSYRPSILYRADGDLRLHLNNITLNKLSVWADLKHMPTSDGSLWFEVTDSGAN